MKTRKNEKWWWRTKWEGRVFGDKVTPWRRLMKKMKHGTRRHTDLWVDVNNGLVFTRSELYETEEECWVGILKKEIDV
jgi:hypothetical protein